MIPFEPKHNWYHQLKGGDDREDERNAGLAVALRVNYCAYLCVEKVKRFITAI